MIKIDKSLLLEAMADNERKILFRGILFLIHRLNFNAVSVGVETQEQQDFMANLDVKYEQGFVNSKPLSANELMIYVQKSNQQATLS